MRFSSALALGLACLTNFGVFGRPTPNGIESRSPPNGGYKSVGYYVNWVCQLTRSQLEPFLFSKIHS